MQIIVSSIGSDEDYEQQFQTVNQLIKEESANNSRKAQTVKLLECLNDILISEDYEPKAKYYAILMAKDFFLKKYSIFVSCLSSSALLQSMIKMAKTIDPKKPVTEKGLTLFLDKALGNRMMRLILECIVKWSEKYPTSNKSSDEPTRFRVAFNELVSEGVVLPKEFTFFPTLNLVGSVNPVSNNLISEKKSVSERNDPKDISKNLRLSLNKIEGFLVFMRDCDDFDEADREIKKYHKLFQEENRKYELVVDQVMDEGLLDDYWTSILFLMSQFYVKENQFYETYLVRDNDIKSYITEVTLASDLLTAKLADTNPPQEIAAPLEQEREMPRPPWQKVNSIESPRIVRENSIKIQKSGNKDEIRPKVYESYSRHESERDLPTNREVQEIPGNRRVQEINSPVEVPISQPLRSAMREEGTHSDRLGEEAEQGAMLIRQVFKEAYKPQSSFVQLKKDLEKERTFKSKNSVLRNKSLRRTREGNQSLDHKTSSRYGKFQQKFIPIPPTNSSRVSIFEMHPKVDKEQYSGQVLDSELNYAYQLEEINANQSLRRFKICAFREKYLLFENEVFQVGFHSEPLYRNHNKYPTLLNITLFIGNKTDNEASEVTIAFEGDKTNAVYAFPSNVPRLIDGGMQVRQSLLIVPLKFPTNLVNFKLKYNHKSRLYRVNVFLPYMINKFAVYKSLDSADFENSYEKLSKGMKGEFRSKVFNLSRKIPPSLLLKYLPNAIELSPYKEFLNQRAYSEYSVGLHAFLLNKFSCSAKINIRPDMTAVIQMVCEGEGDAQKAARILLSTLEFILDNNDSHTS